MTPNSTDTLTFSEPQPHFFWSRFDGTKQPYLLTLPNGGTTRPAGLAIFLHGHGADLRQGMQTDTYGGALGRLRSELEKRHFAYATLNYRGTTSWLNEAAEADITQLIELLTARLGLRKVLLMGGSMGGTSTLMYAVRHPKRLMGVLALCGASNLAEFHGWCREHQKETPRLLAAAIEESYGGTPTERPELFESRNVLEHSTNLCMPVVLVHGEKDELIPVHHSRRLHERLQSRGQTVLYCEITGGDHNAPVVEANWPVYLDFILGRDAEEEFECKLGGCGERPCYQELFSEELDLPHTDLS